MPRQNPKELAQTRRIGQHQAPVDMQGMDPEMAAMFQPRGPMQGVGVQTPGWMQSIGNTIQSMFGPKRGRPATPHPAAPKITTPAEADSIFNKYVR